MATRIVTSAVTGSSNVLLKDIFLKKIRFLLSTCTANGECCLSNTNVLRLWKIEARLSVCIFYYYCGVKIKNCCFFLGNRRLFGSYRSRDFAAPDGCDIVDHFDRLVQGGSLRIDAQQRRVILRLAQLQLTLKTYSNRTYLNTTTLESKDEHIQRQDGKTSIFTAKNVNSLSY